MLFCKALSSHMCLNSLNEIFEEKLRIEHAWLFKTQESQLHQGANFPKPGRLHISRFYITILVIKHILEEFT